MTNNIKCGNSLIGSDYFDGNNLSLFADDEAKKVNAFDWDVEFHGIFTNGGFDCVIGNPPYILIQDLFRDENQLLYFRNQYFSSSYKIDTYHLFFENGINLLNNNGFLGFITPSNYLTNNGLVKMREYFLNKVLIKQLNIINGSVFKNASVDTAITILDKNIKKRKSVRNIYEWKGKDLKLIKKEVFYQNVFKENQNLLFTSIKRVKIKVDHAELGSLYKVKFGMQLRDRKKFKTDVIKINDFGSITKYHKKCYTGRDIKKYYLKPSSLLAFTNRKAKRGGCWDFSVHTFQPKILVRQIGNTPICCLDECGFYSLNTLFMIIPISDVEINIKFLLGLLNSSFIGFYWKNTYYDFRKTFPKIKGSYLEKIPIPKINFDNKKDQSRHDQMVAYVDTMLDLNKKLPKVKTEHEKTVIQRQIDATDRKIDQLVYKLYDLTDAEIAIVEESVSN
jgi:hypothetical protein